ncbi:hypothetical protein DQ04_01341000 [Trypanosoma grayi]|uniref:hypothetical protein n=1 Tax=Trypanosoma grayi TaxID=71804 RepID=UPI0004F44B48|nr:hypothetical protein DQ04_01341000 [Trypanosoma grayi]KEG12898.1 hypothetical protein DQ04_01341000 [Trypanosoma grayi]
MGVEIRRYCRREQDEGSLESLFYLQREVLRVVTIARETLPSQPSAYQRTTYSACAVLAIESYLMEIGGLTEGAVVPFVAIPPLESLIRQREYLASAVSATSSLFDSITPECQMCHLHLAVAITAAAVTASAAFRPSECTPNRMLLYLKELFSRNGILTANATDMMDRFSALGEKGIVCGALWLYTALLADPCSSVPVCAQEESNATVMGASKGEWLAAAHLRHRMLLWGMLTSSEIQPYYYLFPLFSGVVVPAIERMVNASLKNPVSQPEAAIMLQLLYSQPWNGGTVDHAMCTLVDRLLSVVLHFAVTTVAADDIAQACSNRITADRAHKEAIVVLGASTLRCSFDLKRNLSQRLREVASSCKTLADDTNTGESAAATCKLVLTLSAVLLLLEPTSEDRICTRANDASDILSWLQHGPPPEAPFQQVLVIAPLSRPPLLSSSVAKERHFFLLNTETGDGVDESCAISRSVADRLRSPAQAARAAVYLWDEDEGRHTEATRRHAVLARHGVNVLSHRRAQVKRAKTDVMEILQAPLRPEVSVGQHGRGTVHVLAKCCRTERRGEVGPPRGLQGK